MKIILIFLVLLFNLNIYAAPIKIRIGWQVPWALQGQLVQIWKHTNILKDNGIEAEFVGKTYGPELNEVALADGIDVVLTADQPAAVLFSKDKGWVGVSRLMYNRVSTYVPPKSAIKSVKDLKGKTIGVPFGAAAQRIIVESLKANGLDSEKDLKFINLAMPEHAPLIKRASKDAVTWDQFDALSGFDPIPAILESHGLVRSIDTGKVCSLILMNKKFIEKNSKSVKSLKKALAEAYLFYQKNTAKADKWFMEEAKLNEADSNALKLAASLEPNMNVKNIKDISLDFSDEDFVLLQKAAEFVSKNVGKLINMKDYVSN
jgi:sulfonate transport system substrate-binding protein